MRVSLLWYFKTIYKYLAYAFFGIIISLLRSLFPKFEGCGSKIEPATPISNLRFKWPPFGQFWSYWLLLLAQTQWNIAFPKCLCKPSSQTNSFFVINVNVILTLQLSPHVGHFDQHGSWAAESKSGWRMLRKNFWSGSLAYKNTLEKQYFIVSEPKEEVISSKIDRMAAIQT